MNEKEYLEVEKEFNEYTKDYDMKHAKTLLKYKHSFNVAKYMEELARNLYLDEEDVYLAKTIGLLHDIGRFEQLKLYNSFDDSLYDHATFACDYLFKDNHIRDFIKSDKNDNIIKAAIYNHNRYEINGGLNERELFFSKMIRDMDKLDIFYQVGYIDNQTFTEEPTENCVKIFFDGKTLQRGDAKNDSDGVIEVLAFLNDIYFKETFDMIIETDNLGFYLASIDVSKEREEIFNKLRKRCYDIVAGEKTV